jgi:anti-sigma regulatory factor (Ser/Thr protein kinase)
VNARQVAVVRRVVAFALAGHPRLDDVTLAVSELVTNAFMHGSTNENAIVRVRITRLPFGGVHICVTDHGRIDGAQTPVGRPGLDQDAGLGSVIVEQLAWRWCRHRTRLGGRRVHAIFTRRSSL